MQGPGRLLFKYVKSRPTIYPGHDPVPKKTINRQQENNDIVNSAVDEILLNENGKVSDQKEAPEHIESDFDENYFYHIVNIIIQETKEKT